MEQTQNTPVNLTPGAFGNRRAAWHSRISLEDQERYIQSMDPQLFSDSPWPPRRWNGELKRFRRRLQAWQAEVQGLMKHCRCPNCRNYRRGRFPGYYVPRFLSYECWLEIMESERERSVDPTLAEFLDLLSSSRGRNGSAFVGFERSKQRSIRFGKNMAQG